MNETAELMREYDEFDGDMVCGNSAFLGYGYTLGVHREMGSVAGWVEELIHGVHANGQEDDPDAAY